MKKHLFLLLLVVCLLFSSCSRDLPRHFALVATASFGVPYMFRSELVGGGYNVLEEDDYGRVMFSISEYNVFSETDETVIVIMQKYDEQHIYFYEDFCYAPEDSSEETKLALKEKNDWNLPLNEAKMSRRIVNFSLDNHIIRDSKLNVNKLRWAWGKTLEISADQILNYGFSDKDGHENQLYVLVIENNVGEKECYYTIVNTSYEVKYLKIENAEHSEELRAFKQENNWHYGF